MWWLCLLWACRSPAPAEDSGAGDAPSDTGAIVEDADGDGWTTAEGDCDDGDPNVSPTATDLHGDGVDQNCDGTDGIDADGDGYASTGSGGDDCDDTDPAVHPGASDTEQDGTDQDCDGRDAGAATYVGDLQLRSDTAAAEFCEDWTRVAGNLELSGTAVTDSSGLACLTEVTGDLDVESTRLTILELPALVRVGGRLRVADDEVLQGLSLPVLASVGGRLRLDALPGLADLDGLDVLEEIGQELHLSGLDALIVLDGLPALRSAGGLVGEDLGVEEIHFPALAEVTGDIDVGDLCQLETLDLPALEQIDGSLSLAGCAPLTDLSGLDALTDAGGVHLALDDLETLAGLDALRTVGAAGLHLQATGGLADLSALAGLEEVEGTVLLDLQAGRPGTPLPLSSLRTAGPTEVHAPEGGTTDLSLPALETVGGLEVCCDNVASVSLPALVTSTGSLDFDGRTLLVAPALVEVGGDLRLRPEARNGFPVLERVDGDLVALSELGDTAGTSFPALVEVGGDLSLGEYESSTLPFSSTSSGPWELPALETVGGTLSIVRDAEGSTLSLPSLTSLGALYLGGLRALEALDLPALTRVDGDLSVESNERLETVDGLSALVEVDGTLTLSDNAVLHDVSGLHGLTWVGGDLVIEDNAALAAEDAAALVEAIGEDAVAGEIVLD